MTHEVNLSAGDRLLTYQDIQNIFHCGKNRAYELLHSACFPTLQIGGRYYVKQSALNSWIDTYTGRFFMI